MLPAVRNFDCILLAPLEGEIFCLSSFTSPNAWVERGTKIENNKVHNLLYERVSYDRDAKSTSPPKKNNRNKTKKRNFVKSTAKSI